MSKEKKKPDKMMTSQRLQMSLHLFGRVYMCVYINYILYIIYYMYIHTCVSMYTKPVYAAQLSREGEYLNSVCNCASIRSVIPSVVKKKVESNISLCEIPY